MIGTASLVCGLSELSMVRPFTLIIFILLSLQVVVSASADEKTLRVHFINPGYPESFWRPVDHFGEAVARDLGIELTSFWAAGNHLQMGDHAVDVANSGSPPDYVVIVNEKQMAPRMLEALAGAGIRVMLIMNLLTPKQEKEYGGPRDHRFPGWIGSLEPDNEAAGYDIAHILLREAIRRFPKWHEPLSILGMTGSRGTPAATLREAGLRRAAAEAAGLRLEQVVHGYWTREPAERQMMGLLRRHAATRLVWAANDPMAFGAMKAATALGKVPGEDILIGGLNWSGEALTEIRDGRMAVSVGGHFMTLGWALVVIYDHFNDRDFAISEGLEMSYEMSEITRANVGPFLHHFATRDWDQIDFQSFSKKLNPQQIRYEFGLQPILGQLDEFVRQTDGKQE